MSATGIFYNTVTVQNWNFIKDDFVIQKDINTGIVVVVLFIYFLCISVPLSVEPAEPIKDPLYLDATDNTSVSKVGTEFGI